MLFRRTLLALAIVPATLTAPPAQAGGYSVDAACTFAGLPAPDGTLTIAYGGRAVGIGPAGSVAMAVAITCSVTNVPAGGTHSAEKSMGTIGSVGVVADVSLGWEADRAITVCTSAFAVFGPAPVVIVTVPQACQPPL